MLTLFDQAHSAVDYFKNVLPKDSPMLLKHVT
jgi:hypothetical protein